MKLAELLKDIEILNSNADMDTDIKGISYDSRLTEEGELFVAIKGFETDGHRFIPKAREKKAAAVLCQDIPNDGGVYIQVADCRYAMAIASRNLYGNPAGKMTIIGFTGTCGKTSSTYILKHMLEQELHAKVGLIGTNGNMIGQELIHTNYTTPESLELHGLFRKMADAGCTHVVMEVSSHSLSLERVAGINFDVGVFTNLSQDHLDLHGSMEEYAAAKKKLFSQCNKACVNIDDAYGEYMCEGLDCELIRYSAESDMADLVAKDIRLTASSVRFTAVAGEDLAIIRLAIPGSFYAYNALGVIAVGLSLGMSLGQCAEGIGSATGVRGRMETVPTDGDYTVIVDYSHKPDALEKALKTLRPITRGKLTVVFGCGGDRDKLKRPIMGAVAADNADLVVVTDDNPRTERSEDIIEAIVGGLKNKRTAYKIIPNRIEAIQWAIDKAGSGDVILVAGKGHEDYQIIGHEKIHMDDREIVTDYLKKRKAGN